MYNSVERYLKNHIEALSGETCVMYGVDARDILKVIQEEPSVNDWDITYHIKVTKASYSVKKLVGIIYL